MSAFYVTPFSPVPEKKPGSDMGFDFALFGLFVLFLVARVISAIRIDFRGEWRTTCRLVTRQALLPSVEILVIWFLFITIAVHHPDLTCGCIGNLSSIRGPARRG